MNTDGKGTQLRAGLFVLVGLVVFAAVIFLLGEKTTIFLRTTSLYVSFEDINGLVVGAPVRLAGHDIGSVAAITFPEDLTVKQARVQLSIQREYMERVRADSLAFIDSSGLLGDKIVNISVGDPKSRMLQDGDTLATGRTITFEALSAALHTTITTVNGVAAGAQQVLEQMRENHVEDDVARVVASLANLLHEVETGRGVAHRLIYEPSDARNLEAFLADAHGFAQKANRTIGRVDSVVAEIEHGPGSLHELVYGDDVKKAASDLALVAGEVASVAREIREGKGVLHSLIFEEGDQNIVRELEAASASLNRIAQDVEAGRGTIGGLVKDPTVYEDLKSALGNIERNVLFKALVRMTIKNEDLRRTENAPRTVAAQP